MTHPFAVRTAVPDDAPVIARHRAEMFTEMGELSADLYQELFDRSSAWLRGAIASGEYVGWLACAGGDVIAGAGVQVRRILPRPTASEAGMAIAAGREAIVLNVFTEREWRGRGLARLLMRHVLQWARAEAVDRLVLHASEQGRPLYDQLGFVPTTEMRYSGPLR